MSCLFCSWGDLAVFAPRYRHLFHQLLNLPTSYGVRFGGNFNAPRTNLYLTLRMQVPNRNTNFSRGLIANIRI